MIILCMTLDLPFTTPPYLSLNLELKLETSWAETLLGEACHLVAFLSST